MPAPVRSPTERALIVAARPLPTLLSLRNLKKDMREKDVKSFAPATAFRRQQLLNARIGASGPHHATSMGVGREQKLIIVLICQSV